MIFAHAKQVTRVMPGVKHGLNWLGGFRRSLETDLASLNQIRPTGLHKFVSKTICGFSALCICSGIDAHRPKPDTSLNI